MPRTARIVLPNCPHHVIHYAHNRADIFTEPRHYKQYLYNIQECKKLFDFKIYAYCLMTNHVHLIIDPLDDPRTLGLLMKRLAARQTRFINHLKHRSGSLWEGRYKSSPIDIDNYLLACSRYIELNPVRLGVASTPEAYPWSSYGYKVGKYFDDIVDLDSCYLAMGSDSSMRQELYRQWIAQDIPDNEWKQICYAVQRNQLTGSSQFIKNVEKLVGYKFNRRKPGRPKKINKEKAAVEQDLKPLSSKETNQLFFNLIPTFC